MGDTITTFDGLLKQYYDDSKVQNLVYKENPFLALVEKDEGFSGDAFKVPAVYSPNNALGQNFGRAQNQARGSNAVGNSSVGNVAFLINSRAHQFGFANWSRETMLASANNMTSFLKVATLEMDMKMREFGNRLATLLWRNGYGDVGNISTTTFTASGTTITLANPESVVNFEVGQLLDFSATQTGAVRGYGSSGNPLAIAGIDRSNGILTFNFALNDATNGVPNIAAGDYIFLYNDNHQSGAGTSNGQVLPIGVEGWMPAASPSSSDSFWGVNRSVDSRLYGQRINATDGRPLEEVLIEGANLVGREGGTLTHYFMSWANYSKLDKQLQGRVIYNQVEHTDAQVGWKGITLRCAYGDITVLPDRSCPPDRVYGVDISTWTLATLGPMIGFVNEDGLEILRQDTASNFEARYEFYGQLVCRAPGWNVNIQVPTA